MRPLLDPEPLRRATPGCSSVLHLNNAGAALPSQRTLDVQIAHLHREAERGGYEAAAEAAPRLEAVYTAIARLLGAQADEIALTDSATRAWQLAFYAVPLRPGDRILTSVAEYGANYIAYLQRARQTGAEIVVIPDDAQGQLDLDALAQALGQGAALVSITHIPTNGGLINPAAAVGRLTRAAGVPYLLDACQSVGQIPVDVQAIGCDFLSATGRKYLRGPRGTGFLWIAPAAMARLEPPMLDLHGATWVARDQYQVRDDARRFECWEASIAGRLGLGSAVEEALQLGMAAIGDRICFLAAQLRARLQDVPGAQVHDKGAVQGGIVTFTVADREPTALQLALRAQGINVSTTWRDSTRLDMEARQLDGMVRASVHAYNTEAELDRFCAALAAL